MEIYRVWTSDEKCVFIGVSNDSCFATKSEILLVKYCEQMGWGIPLDWGIKDFSVGGFFDYIKTHPVLSKIESWDEIGLTKPKLCT